MTTTTNTMNLIPSNMVDTEYTELVNRYGADAVNRQLDLEMEGQTLGKIRYMNKVEQERVKGNGANVGAAKGFLTTAIPMVIDGLNNCSMRSMMVRRASATRPQHSLRT